MYNLPTLLHSAHRERCVELGITSANIRPWESRMYDFRTYRISSTDRIHSFTSRDVDSICSPMRL